MSEHKNRYLPAVKGQLALVCEQLAEQAMNPPDKLDDSMELLHLSLTIGTYVRSESVVSSVELLDDEAYVTLRHNGAIIAARAQNSAFVARCRTDVVETGSADDIRKLDATLDTIWPEWREHVPVEKMPPFRELGHRASQAS